MRSINTSRKTKIETILSLAYRIYQSRMTILKPEDERSDVHRGNDINHIKDKLLSSLVDEGLVEVISDEMYRLTEEGKNIV